MGRATPDMSPWCGRVRPGWWGQDIDHPVRRRAQILAAFAWACWEPRAPLRRRSLRLFCCFLPCGHPFPPVRTTPGPRLGLFGCGVPEALTCALVPCSCSGPPCFPRPNPCFSRCQFPLRLPCCCLPQHLCQLFGLLRPKTLLLRWAPFQWIVLPCCWAHGSVGMVFRILPPEF